VGNATELKNTLMLNGALAPHYNYCGDSVLGNDVNLGAGTKLSNWKIAANKSIRFKVGDRIVDTGLEKFGAILGDGAATGCNSVLNPGTVLGKKVMVYACAAVRGYVPPNTVVKLRQQLDYEPLS
jgi:bifunctional N-acetylglucosamine-1-phosphate-uridyltransferase/glucosamine-1-phosphate-acetyltransferase GlmU-like protein